MSDRFRITFAMVESVSMVTARVRFTSKDRDVHRRNYMNYFLSRILTGLRLAGMLVAAVCLVARRNSSISAISRVFFGRLPPSTEYLVFSHEAV